jgi:hypothetical protein
MPRWVYYGIAGIVLLFIVFCVFKRRRQCNRTRTRVLLESNAISWDTLWDRALKIRNSAHIPVQFQLDGVHIQDKPISSKTEFERLVRHSATWATRRANVEVKPFKIKWRHGPTMEYLNSTLTISPDTLDRFTDADVVLATAHEIAGHHYQENRDPNNDSEQKEMCGMTCEKMLWSLSKPLVNRWILMRLVRGLIDLKINAAHQHTDKSSVEEIYSFFGSKMMTLSAIVDMVTEYPGSGLSYLGDEQNVGNDCACTPSKFSDK